VADVAGPGPCGAPRVEVPLGRTVALEVVVLHVVPDIDFRNSRGTPIPPNGGSAMGMLGSQVLALSRGGVSRTARTTASVGPRSHGARVDGAARIAPRICGPVISVPVDGSPSLRG
jgi:hypothetical protein